MNMKTRSGGGVEPESPAGAGSSAPSPADGSALTPNPALRGDLAALGGSDTAQGLPGGEMTCVVFPGSSSLGWAVCCQAELWKWLLQAPVLKSSPISHFCTQF